MDSFFRIRFGTLVADVPITFDVYARVNNRFIHYLRAGEKLTIEKIKAFDGAQVFHVSQKQRSTYKKYIFDCMNSPKLLKEEKIRILRESSQSLAEEIFEQSDLTTSIEDSKHIVQHFLEFMDEDPISISQLVGLSSHDFYTYNHSLDVSIYSLGLGRILQLDASSLVELGRGALFHDVGKRKVDVGIICKDGPLTDNEWMIMQQHPSFGLEILYNYSCSEEILACCFEHHESWAGNGYPQQLKADEIHPMARIVAIADTFDALTTKRSYNEPMSIPSAIEFMNEKLRDRFDSEPLKALTSLSLILKQSA